MDVVSNTMLEYVGSYMCTCANYYVLYETGYVHSRYSVHVAATKSWAGPGNEASVHVQTTMFETISRSKCLWSAVAVSCGCKMILLIKPVLS